MKKYFKIILFPLAVIVANGLSIYLPKFLPEYFEDILFNIIRFAAWGYAGYLLTFVGGYPIWKAALSGAILLFIDHPIIRGGGFLFQKDFMAFGGVIVSCLMFIWISIAVSALGAFVGKQRNKKLAENKNRTCHCT
jgi:hypothetical protein